ncbi:POU domain, class 5, transcription factor 2 [Manis pentadactyla]|uniref:POU domain, class 5, transcription factor 2 n=1 Tax=Manis pentadactyla TaxID=143292 RepID=UPI00255D10BA|nr:POU domain, class 5, transcription factor 2 [Manis pentadactyla]
MAGPRLPNYSLVPGSGEGGPRGPVSVGVDTPIWLSAHAAPGRLMVQPGIGPAVCPGPEMWEVPLNPQTYEFQGKMVPCERLVRAGEARAWLPNPFQGAIPGPYVTLRSIPSLALPEDVSVTEKEMEQLANELRQKRMTLGYSQADVGFAVGALFGKELSQTTICRFESQQLSLANMWKLQPLLKMWLEEVDTKNLLGLCRMEMILQQARKWRQASRERRIRNNLEKLFLQCPKPTAQQISCISAELQLQKDLVRVWFYTRSRMSSQPARYFSPPEEGAAIGPPFPGGLVCFPLSSEFHFGSPYYGGPYFTPLYPSAPFPVGRALLSAPATNLGLPRLSSQGACLSGEDHAGETSPWHSFLDF